MIVLRLVPLAREALLHEIGEPSQSSLPDCTIDLQAAHLVDPSEEGASNGKSSAGTAGERVPDARLRAAGDR